MESFLEAINLLVTAKYLFFLMANGFPHFDTQGEMKSTGDVF